MPRWLMYLLLLTVALTVLGGAHYYFYRRLVLAPQLPAPWRRLAGTALVALCLSFPVAVMLSRRLPHDAARWVLFPVYVWLGLVLMLAVVLAAADVLRGLWWLASRLSPASEAPADPARRLVIARSLAAITAGLVSVGGLVAAWRGLGRLIVKPVEVVLPKLPAALDGFTIAQLTDMHLGAMRTARFVREVVERTNAAKPDLIVITGDLADAHPDDLGEEVALMRKLRAAHGVYFVTGNHEYFTALHAWLRTLRQMGIAVLRNERVAIERQGHGFDLAGIDDHSGHRFFPDHGADIPKAVAGRDRGRALVLLAHQPRAVLEACNHAVDLVLSGHTHGGQIWPWKYLVYLQQPYIRGLHEHRGTQLYVSQGTGFWGPPMRLGTTAEITLVKLRAAKRA